MIKKTNSYDEIKGMLNIIRKINSRYGTLREQVETQQAVQQPQYNQNTVNQEQTSSENEDIFVINGIDVEIHSEDSMDLALNDTEKGVISQLVDDFRVEVSEIAEFDRLDIYPNSAKLSGTIPDMGVSFTLSTGDDKGLFLSNTSMLKINPDYLSVITKLNSFEEKFSNTINDLLVNRRG